MGIRKGTESSSQSSFYRSIGPPKKKKKTMSVQERVAKHRSSQTSDEKKIDNAITIARRHKKLDVCLELDGKKREREFVCRRGAWNVYRKLDSEIRVSDGRVKNEYIAFHDE